jgi:HYR domain-containing protein
MKTKRTIPIVMLLVALAAIVAFGMFRQPQPVKASATSSVLSYPVTIRPSETDGNTDADDCDQRPKLAIGCEKDWPERATNTDHFLYLPPKITETGKLLVFLCGGKGRADVCKNVFPVAAQQGYHVIGLTYAVALDDCQDLTPEENLACFGEVLSETVTGDDKTERTNFSEHGQDSIVNRLRSVLKWAKNNQNEGDGWERYLTSGDEPDWSKINLAGHSNGSSHVSFMGTQPHFQSVGRVALFAGPNDGRGSSEQWTPSNYIRNIPGMTDTRYFGLVHRLNKAHSYLESDNVLFKVTNDWQAFGMEGRTEFDPMVGTSPDFGNAHMLISIDPTPSDPAPIPSPTDQGTTPAEAHNSVVKDRYCTKFDWDDETKDDPNDYKCTEYEGAAIGYEPAWRCVLGAGDVSVSSSPIADAGPNQIVECEGGGAASVTLDGSATRDDDCGVLTYTWTGPFGVATGQKPIVLLPIGTHLLTLVVQDEWSLSDSKTVLITVQDTQPPTISCPGDIVVEPTCSTGAIVSYTAPVGADGCTEAITTQTAGLASGSIFPIGTTTVTFTATDTANNTASCSFAVKVLTAEAVIQDLMSRVQALQPPLSGQQAQGLRSKLNEALVAIDRDQKNVACNKLKDFINQVQTYINNGKLTSAQGQPLIDSAAHVRNTLGCTTLGCT